MGQAIWDCGTLDIDCIKYAEQRLIINDILTTFRLRNCIDASSQCFGCICEVLDIWWPSDAPNCFKKELIRALDERDAKIDTENITHTL